MAAIDVINDNTGERTRMTRTRLAAISDRGWRETTPADDAKPADRQAEVAIDLDEARRAGVLAEVGDDTAKAAAAFDAESALDEPDEQLLAALEAVALGEPPSATAETTVIPSEED